MDVKGSYSVVENQNVKRFHLLNEFLLSTCLFRFFFTTLLGEVKSNSLLKLISWRGGNVICENGSSLCLLYILTYI